MVHRKPKCNTTYREHHTDLSALDAQTMRMIQCIWAYCAMEVKLSEQMILFSLIMGIGDDDADFFFFFEDA